MFNKLITLSSIFTLVILFSYQSMLFSKNFEFKYIDLQRLTRYNEDRIVYQHVQKNISDTMDNSVASLLVIKDSKIYLLTDGYDNEDDVQAQRLKLDIEHQMIPDLWVNKIDNTPDYFRVLDRKIEILHSKNKEEITQNYGDFFQKVRETFLKKHVNIFKALIVNRRDSGLHVSRKEIPRRIHDDGPARYAISVTARTMDEKVYYAEDADGDGITETFTVQIADGFTWGAKSGANIILIINNQQKEITDIIGKIAHESYYGTPEEINYVKSSFPTTNDVSDMIDDIYQVNRVFKENLEKQKNSGTK